ncbi:three-helix bundle dimerization domain-containing protein [Gordonia sp. AC31]|uniref:three-helix bundle dimerization domain-containing protein n=1 Tax=Gordonia sp. AC31 TaxID=2962571 RepID=UPI00288A03C6|nr:hypothetical protein [Gordonia sp. AC31]
MGDIDRRDAGRSQAQLLLEELERHAQFLVLRIEQEGRRSRDIAGEIAELKDTYATITTLSTHYGLRRSTTITIVLGCSDGGGRTISIESRYPVGERSVNPSPRDHAPALLSTMIDTMGANNDELRQISEVRDRLIGLYSHRSPEEVSTAVDKAYRHFDGIEVRDFVPLLVERRANKALGGTDAMADPTQVPPHIGR